MTYGPGKRIAGDDRRRPWVDWVLYGLDDGVPYVALYVGGCLVHPGPDGWWRHDWPTFCRHYQGSPDMLRIAPETLQRARASHRPGWPLLPDQGGILWTSNAQSSSTRRTSAPNGSDGYGLNVSCWQKSQSSTATPTYVSPPSPST